MGLTPTAGRGQARVHLHERALHDDRAPLLSRYRLCARDAPVSGASVNAKSRTPLPRGAIIFARRSRKRAAPLNWGRLRTPCRLALAGGTYARDVYAARASVWRSHRTERAAIFPTPVALFLVSLFRSRPPRWFANRECECALRFGTARNGGHHACEPRFGCFWRRISCFRMSRGTLIIFIGRWMSDISAQPMKIRVHLQSKGGKITSENPLSISSRHPAFHVAPNRASCTEFCAAVTSPMHGKAASDVSGSEFTAESPAVSLRFRTTARGRIAIAGMCRNCIMRNSHDRVSFLKWDMGVIWHGICARPKRIERKFVR